MKLKHSFKPQKHHNKPRYVDGIYFKSIKESERYKALKAAMSGPVLFFIRQPIFDLPGGVTWKADFLVFYKDGTTTVEDTKGQRTDSYVRNKKMVEALYPVTIIET
jgi:hypothetical protein